MTAVNVYTPAEEAIALTAWLIDHYQADGLAAIAGQYTSALPVAWDELATMAELPRPTSAVQATVVSRIRSYLNPEPADLEGLLAVAGVPQDIDFGTLLGAATDERMATSREQAASDPMRTSHALDVVASLLTRARDSETPSWWVVDEARAYAAVAVLPEPTFKLLLRAARVGA